jgi:hypothetical protein
MPVSSAVADPYTTDPSGEPQEDSVPAEYQALVASLLALLAAYLAPRPRIPVPDWVYGRWMVLPRFRLAVRRELARTSARVTPLVVHAVRATHGAGAAAAARDARWAGPLPDVPEAEVEAVREALEAAHPRIQAVLEDTYRRALDAARRAQGDPGPEVQRVLDDLARQGITGFTDRAGRRWSLETYVETVVRANYSQAALDAYLDVCRSANVRLVVVSFAPGACPRCVPWERRTLSIDGTPPGEVVVAGPGGYRRTVVVAGTLEQARAAGLLHPWCRHRLTAWSPGRSRRLAPGPVTDRVARAEARYRRRTARAWERRQQVALSSAARGRAQQRIRRWTTSSRREER